MASALATMYYRNIKRGSRTIDIVRPDELKNEVIELLVAEGLYDLAGVEEPKAVEPVPLEPAEEVEDAEESADKETKEETPVEVDSSKDEEEKAEEPEPSEESEQVDKGDE